MPVCPPASPHEGASVGKYTNRFWCEHALFMNRNAAFVDVDVSFADGNASFTDGNVSFTHGNAAARTFGRVHRRRPYHFSYGSYHKIAGESFAAV